jgi:hypothetical protein
MLPQIHLLQMLHGLDSSDVNKKTNIEDDHFRFRFHQRLLRTVTFSWKPNS